MESVAVAGLRDDARPAFADFYAATWPALAAYCQTLTGSAHVADELAQEAFVRLYVRYPLLREPRPYVFRIATNLARDAWRRERFEAPVEAPPDPAPQVAPGDGLGLFDAVRRLPVRQRDAVLLRYYAGLSVDEVAHALRRPSGTVKRWLHEARARLAAELEE